MRAQDDIIFRDVMSPFFGYRHVLPQTSLLSRFLPRKFYYLDLKAENDAEG